MLNQIPRLWRSGWPVRVGLLAGLAGVFLLLVSLGWRLVAPDLSRRVTPS